MTWLERKERERLHSAKLTACCVAGMLLLWLAAWL